MKKLLNPWWIFIAHTLPLLVLFFISFSEFTLIKSLLSETQMVFWGHFCIAFIGILFLNAGYATFKYLTKEKVDWIYSILNIIVSIIFLWFYYKYNDDLIPWSVPSWMLSGNLLAYSGAFFMPSFIYNTFCLVLFLTKKTESKNPWLELVYAILVPIVFYFFAVQIVSLWSLSSSADFLFFFLIISGIFIFLFFALRFFYILRSRHPFNPEIRIVWTIVFGIFLPGIGLFLNKSMDNIIGDFSDSWFFIVAALNGFFLSLPDVRRKTVRLLLYIARCITFSFTLYFLIVFLPFLPLSIILILAAGLGVVMLTPIVLFFIHSNVLWNDFGYLKIYYRPFILILIGFISLGVLPLSLSGKYYMDKIALLSTLEYVYSPDYSKDYSLKQSSIERTLNTLDGYHNRYGGLYSSTPFLSGLYKKIVLNNQGISYEKKQTLSHLFKGDTYGFSLKPRRQLKEKDIRIINVECDSRYDVQKGVWVSTVDLDIKNFSDSRWNTEYITYFKLPDGCWISDYYLYVNGVKEPGILAEKKAATWIFSQIRNQHLDPGLLTYVGGNTVEFKVFPFEIDEVRKTGIEFIHIDPVSFGIDYHTIDLGDSMNPDYLTAGSSFQTNKDCIYLSADQKAKLPYGNPQPYYHFIVDISGNKESGYYGLEDEFEKRRRSFEYDIREFLEYNPLASETCKITYANYGCYTVEKKINELPLVGWEEDIPSRAKPFEGGFFLQRAVEHILVDNFQNPRNSYPVLVLLTENLQKAVITKGFDDLEFTYPFQSSFYWLKGKSYLSLPLFGGWNKKIVDYISEFNKYQSVDYKIASYKMNEDGEYYNESTGEIYCDVTGEESQVVAGNGHIAAFSLPEVNVKEYGKFYFLPDNDCPSFVLNRGEDELPEFPGKKMDTQNRTTALEIEARKLRHTLNPQQGEKEWLAMLQASFATRILTPETAYIVVETEAQRQALKRKQDEVMTGNKNMDVGEEVMAMSEPDLILLLLLLAVGLFIKRKNLCRR